MRASRVFQRVVSNSGLMGNTTHGCIHCSNDHQFFKGSLKKLKDMQATKEAGQIAGLEGEGDRLAAVQVKGGNGVRRVEGDTVLAFYGLKMELGPIAGWGHCSSPRPRAATWLRTSRTRTVVTSTSASSSRGRSRSASSNARR